MLSWGRPGGYACVIMKLCIRVLRFSTRISRKLLEADRGCAWQTEGCGDGRRARGALGSEPAFSVGDPQMSVFMDSLPPKRLHSPAWGCVSLTSGQRKKREPSPPSSVRRRRRSFHSLLLSPDPASPATCPVSAKQEP